MNKYIFKYPFLSFFTSKHFQSASIHTYTCFMGYFKNLEMYFFLPWSDICLAGQGRPKTCFISIPNTIGHFP